MNALLLTLALLLTTIFAYDDQNLTLTTSNTPGGHMVGATVEVLFNDGTTDVQYWTRVDENTGQAVGLFFTLYFSGVSTFPDLSPISPPESKATWSFQARKPVRSFIVDLSTGSAVWDIIKFTLVNNNTYTPRSGDGFPFSPLNATDDNIPSGSYSGVPTFPGRQIDVWYVLTVVFDDAFLGILTFYADTDTLSSSVPDCRNLPTIAPLKAIFVPEFRPDAPVPSIWTAANGTEYLHIEFWSYSATNRRTGIDPSLATLIFFGTVYGEDYENCTQNVDYFWQFYRSTDEYGACIDVYTLDFELARFLLYCRVTYTYKNESDVCNFEINGVITVRTITDRQDIRQGSGVVIKAASEEWSQHGFIIQSGGCINESDIDVRVYAPVYISAVIDEYFIPEGATEKTFYILTFIQDPQLEGFRLQYNGGVVLIAEPGFISSPDPERADLLTLSYVEVSSGCTLSEQEGNDGVVQLCAQNWLLSIIPDPSVCIFKDLFVYVPYTVVCNNPNPLLCPLDNITNNVSIVVHINTASFCPVTISTYSLVGRLTAYRSDFRARAISFFTNQTVGFEYQIDNVIPSRIQSIRITYLAAVLAPNSNADLYPPNINTIIQNNGSAAIIIGATPPIPNRATDVLYTEVCPPFPRNPPFQSGCPPNIVRFTLVLNPLIWPIRADNFANLKFAISAVIQLKNGSSKRDADNTEDLSTTDATVSTVAYIVQ